VSCQSGKRGDWFGASSSNKYKKNKKRDSYTTASGKESSMDFHDTYSNAGGRNRSKEGRDSYSSSSSGSSSKRSSRSWKFWKKKKGADAYNVSRKRKRFKKRKPPQGIKAS
jgi:hypothetical protein